MQCDRRTSRCPSDNFRPLRHIAKYGLPFMVLDPGIHAGVAAMVGCLLGIPYGVCDDGSEEWRRMS